MKQETIIKTEVPVVSKENMAITFNKALALTALLLSSDHPSIHAFQTPPSIVGLNKATCSHLGSRSTSNVGVYPLHASKGGNNNEDNLIKQPSFQKKSSSSKTFFLKKDGAKDAAVDEDKNRKPTGKNSTKGTKGTDGKNEENTVKKAQSLGSFFQSSINGINGINGEKPNDEGQAKNATEKKVGSKSPSTPYSFQFQKPIISQTKVNGEIKKEETPRPNNIVASFFKTLNPTGGDDLMNRSSVKDDVKPVEEKSGETNIFTAFASNFSNDDAKEGSAEKISASATPNNEVRERPIDKLSSETAETETKSTFNFMDKIKNPFADSKPKANNVNLKPGEEIITNDITGFTTTIINKDIRSLFPQEPKNKFTFAQRIESVKTGIVGLFAGGISLTPFALIHDVIFKDQSIANGLAQWEFDTDTGSIATALFAIVYRYCVRDGEETNEMLQMGVIGAFVIVRTLARIRVPIYCSAVPLDCGEPLGYFDYNMIQQGIGSGLESVVMFGATALAIEYCYEKGFISRFK